MEIELRPADISPSELQDLRTALKASGIPYAVRAMAFDSAEPTIASNYIADVIDLAKVAVPSISYVLVTWIKAKAGRKIKLTIKETGKARNIQLEAEEADDILKVLEKVQAGKGPPLKITKGHGSSLELESRKDDE